MENVIGIRLMGQEFQALELGTTNCEMCLWLEHGLRSCESPREVEGYATEILIHRRNLHVASVDNVN